MPTLFSSVWFNAAESGDLSRIQTYLTQGFDVQTRDPSYQHTALHLACQEGHLDMVQFLLSCGAAVNPSDSLKQIPLHLACATGHLGVVQTLLAHGGDVHAVTSLQTTPLHLASLKGHFEIARVLLSHGADLFALTCYGQTPLSLAEYYQRIDVITLLQTHHHHLTLQSHLTASPSASDSHACPDASSDAQRPSLRL